MDTTNVTHDGEYIPAPGHDEHVAEEPIDEADLAPQKMLTYTQGMRRRLVQDITRGGLPQDKADRQILLNALHDADQTAVNQMRHDLDKENATNGRVVQDIVDRVAGQLAYGMRAAPGHEQPRKIEVDDSALEGHEIGEGEVHVGVEQETASEFLNRMDGSGKE